ncbi:MAG: hypothetical protein ABW148_07500, partial [Sedimenticola sp.]
TEEFDDDATSTTSPATASTSNVLHFEIEGEVAVAEASLSAVNDAGDTITDDETGADEIVVLTEDNGVTGAQGDEGFPGRRIDFDYTTETQDRGPGSDNSEAITRIVLDKGASDGNWVFDSDGDGTLDLIIEDAAGSLISEADAGLVVLNPNTDGHLELSFTNPDVEFVDLNNAIGIRLFPDDSTDFDLTVTTNTQESDDDGVSTTSPATASTSNVLHFEIEGEVAVAEASLSAVNDAGDTITDDETGADEIVVLTEDNGVTGAQGAEGFPGRRIDFDFTAKTQDEGFGSDNSEGITRIVLDKGVSDGNWVFDSDGDGTLGLIIKDATGILISESAAGLVVLNPNADGKLELSFTNPDVVESVDLNNAIGIRLFPDDSTDFDLTITTTTQEFDDDGVSTTSPDTAS